MPTVPTAPLRPASPGLLERQAQLVAFEKRPKVHAAPGEKRTAHAPTDDFTLHMPGAWRDEAYRPELRPAPQAEPWPEPLPPPPPAPPAPPPLTPRQICARHAVKLEAVQVDLIDEMATIAAARDTARAQVPGPLRTLVTTLLRALAPVALGLGGGLLFYMLPLGAVAIGLMVAAATYLAVRDNDPMPPAALPEAPPKSPQRDVLLATRPRLALALYQRQMAVAARALDELKRARLGCANLDEPDTTSFARLHAQASKSHQEVAEDVKKARALMAQQKNTSRLMSLGAATGALALLNLFGDVMGPLGAVWRGATTATSFYWVESSLRSVSALRRPSLRALEDYITVREGEMALLALIRDYYRDVAIVAGTPLETTRWPRLKAFLQMLGPKA